MKPFPTTDYYDDCYASAYVSSNGIKSLCTVAYKAAVNASGVVRLTPLSTATFNYSYPGPDQSQIPMPCKNMNASGLLNGAPQSRGDSVSLHVTLPAHTYCSTCHNRRGPSILHGTKCGSGLVAAPWAAGVVPLSGARITKAAMPVVGSGRCPHRQIDCDQQARVPPLSACTTHCQNRANSTYCSHHLTSTSACPHRDTLLTHFHVHC
jgi:hypothetical protein